MPYHDFYLFISVCLENIQAVHLNITLRTQTDNTLCKIKNAYFTHVAIIKTVSPDFTFILKQRYKIYSNTSTSTKSMLALANPASISLGLNICLDGKTHIPEQQPDRFWILLF